jgi:hypothetical protein
MIVKHCYYVQTAKLRAFGNTSSHFLATTVLFTVTTVNHICKFDAFCFSNILSSNFIIPYLLVCGPGPLALFTCWNASFRHCLQSVIVR